MATLILRFRAPDRPGIVARIGSVIAGHDGDIRDAQVYGDDETGGFFVRMVIATATSRSDLAAALAPLAGEMTLDWSLHDSSEKLRVLLVVSRSGHCLVDLIHKAEIGQLPIEIVGVVSNHETMRKTVEWHGLPYHHLPTSDGKAAQEAAFLELIAA